jgi:hypothetical protein
MRQLPAVAICLTVAGLALQLHRPALAGPEEPAGKDEARELMDELQAVERKVETLKRLLTPADGSEAADVKAGIEGRAHDAELASVELKPGAEGTRLPLPDGRPSAVELRPVEISGRDSYQKVHRFLGFLARSKRLFVLDSLRLQAAEDDSVAFTLRLDMAVCVDPCGAHSKAAPTPASFQDAKYERLVARRRALEDDRLAAQRGGHSGGPARQQAALIEQREIARKRALLDHLIQLRQAFLEQRQFLQALVDLGVRSNTSRRIVAALGALDHAAVAEALALTQVRYGPEGGTLFEGLLLGALARRGLKQALETAGFEPGPVKTSPAGECQAFSLTARLGAAEPGDEIVVGNGLFDAGASAACALQAHAPPLRVRARGATPATAGGLTLQLRDVDVADVFRVLHDYTGQAFVVDPDVTGRVDMDLEGATLEEAIGALEPVGVVVGLGPLRRVARAAHPHTAAPGRSAYAGQPISVSFKQGDLRDMLCFFEDFGKRPIRVSANLDARASVFARDTPWDQILDAVASSADLTVADAKEGLFVGPEAVARAPGRPGAVDPCKPLEGPYHRSWRSAPARPDSLGVEDLHLAGLALDDGAWTAYAYGLSRILLSLVADQRVLDGRISAVGPKGITLEADTGKRLELPLAP